MTTETVVTGLAWMGTGVRSVQSALKDMLREAEHEVLWCAYSITGGADEILEEFEDCLKRGIKLSGIINRFQNQSQEIQLYFRNLVLKYPYCQQYCSVKVCNCQCSGQNHENSSLSASDKSQFLVIRTVLVLSGL
jgi:sugar-specific transcriptional regulator TrmB